MLDANNSFNWNFLKNWKPLFLLNEIKKASTTEQLPDWNSINSFFEKCNTIRDVNLFTNLTLISWKQLTKFYENFINLSKKEKDDYLSLVDISNTKLAKFKGDPLNFSWNNDFRPLRLSREEDWSDWLAFLIKKSNGNFINNLFGFYRIADKVEREYVAEGARADIVIKWDNNNCGTHIEVKVGDQNLAKTHGTSVCVRNRMNEVIEWDDFILLLDNQIESWNSIIELNKNASIEITPTTWTDVAIALRKCLYQESEDILWQSFAFAFTGCIEMKLYDSTNIKNVKLDRFIISLYNQNHILKRSLENGQNK